MSTPRVMRLAVAAALAALVLAGCGGQASLDPIGEGEDRAGDADPLSGDAPGGAATAEDVLSGCAPAGDATTVTLVEATGDRPPLEEMEGALEDNPDAQFMIDQLEQDLGTREDAVHAMYGQVVGERLLAAARSLPGFVTAAYARPETGEPFQLAFSGELPDDFDPAEFELASYGLEVTTNASGFDHEAFGTAYETAVELGMRAVSGYGDEVAGTGTIEVIDATPEEVVAWEEAVGDAAATICLVRAEVTQSCDGPAVDAELRGTIIPHGGEDTSPTEEEADEIARSYIGLSLAEAEAKAAEEGRDARVVVEDGVELGRNDDLRPGRANLTVCDDVVVDVDVEGIGEYD